MKRYRIKRKIASQQVIGYKQLKKEVAKIVADQKQKDAILFVIPRHVFARKMSFLPTGRRKAIARAIASETITQFLMYILKSIEEGKAVRIKYLGTFYPENIIVTDENGEQKVMKSFTFRKANSNTDKNFFGETND